MNRFLKIASVMLILAVLGVPTLTYVAVLGARGQEHREEITMIETWRRVEPKVMADEARWSTDPLFTPQVGPDAAPLLFAHVSWENEANPIRDVPAAIADQLKEGWLSKVDSLDLTAIDLEWMKGLAAFGFWETEGPGTPLATTPVSSTETLVRFSDLQTDAKVRLLQGLKAGDARPAAAEVRELARLFTTTEQLIGSMFGVALLGIERKAFEEAERRHQPTEGWQPYAEQDVESLKRTLWASAAPFGVMATPPLSDAVLPVGQCRGLNEALWFSHLAREWAQVEFRDRYERLAHQLENSPCRLTRMRAVWAKPSLERFDDRGGFYSHLPFVDAWVANKMLVAANVSWLSKYEVAKP